jgi:hypothetical protein
MKRKGDWACQHRKPVASAMVYVRHGYPWVPTDEAQDRPRQVGSAY